MTLQWSTGVQQAISRVVPDGRRCRAVGLATAAFQDFGKCPICLGSLGRGTREHVPQEDLGGQRMTVTCASCNNRLGSFVEPELRDWFDDALKQVWLSGDAVQGRRRISRVLVRAVGDQVALIPEKPLHPDLQALFESGQFDMEVDVPDPAVWAIAAMKHAYLGACLLLGRIPDSRLAVQIRRDLVAARDTSNRGAIPPSAIAQSLRVTKTLAPASPVAVALVALVDEKGTVLDTGLSLAGTMFVSWPLEVALWQEVVRQAAQR